MGKISKVRGVFFMFREPFLCGNPDSLRGPRRMEQVGQDLKRHWSLYQGTVYNKQQWQKEVNYLIPLFGKPHTLGVSPAKALSGSRT